MQALWQEADEIWDTCRNHLEFGAYVSADYLEIFRELTQLQGRVETVLEWGSGLGVVAIMASRLGFDAYGIEVEPLLVERSQALAKRFRCDVQFVQGSFIPDEYAWNVEQIGENSRTETDSCDAYAELDLDIRDFDLVYAYPWPDEHDLYRDILQQCGRLDALLLTYDAREGAHLTRVSDVR